MTPDQYEPRVGIVRPPVASQGRHEVVGGLVGKELSDEQPDRRVLTPFPVGGHPAALRMCPFRHDDERWNDGRGAIAGRPQITLVETRDGDGVTRARSQLVELRPTGGHGF